MMGRMQPTSALGFDMASRTRFVFDDTIQNGEAEVAGAAFLNAMLMLWGKDVQAGSIEFEGDPEILPGEAIRVWNMGVYPPPDNIFRTEAVVHSYTATGPKRGYYTNIMFSSTEASLVDKYTATTFSVDQTVNANTSEG